MVLSSVIKGKVEAISTKDTPRGTILRIKADETALESLEASNFEVRFLTSGLVRFERQATKKDNRKQLLQDKIEAREAEINRLKDEIEHLSQVKEVTDNVRDIVVDAEGEEMDIPTDAAEIEQMLSK